MSVESGLAALRAGRLAEAREAAEACLAGQPDDMAARHLLARVYEAGGDLEGALSVNASIDPAVMPRAVADRARLLARSGQGAAALQLCRHAAARGQPGDASMLNGLGEVAGQLGELAVAEACFRRAASMEPRAWAARYNLALALMPQGRTAEAGELLEAVTSMAPAFAGGWLHRGGVLNSLGRYREAAAALRRHLELAPGSAPGWTWFGASRQYLGDFTGAEAAYRKAIELDPRLADARANLGRLLLANGQAEAGERLLHEALALAPDHAIARAGLAGRRERDGRLDEALALLEGNAPETRLHRSRLYRRLRRHEDALAELAAVRRDTAAPADARRQAAFSTAQALDEAGRHEEAAAELVRANADRRGDWQDAGWDPDEELARLESAAADLERVFAEGSGELPRSGLDGRGTVLIVGLPRAGKSLLEQALAAHPEIAAAGELTALGDIAADLPQWPVAARNLTQERLAREGARYLKAAGAAAPRILDTMPFNFLNIGLIGMLLPGARVIGLHRHPADLALRCLFKNFAGRSLAFTTSIEALGRWLSVYERVMGLWRRAEVTPLHEVYYENLVHQPEQTLRGVLGFLELPWDPCVLEFHRIDVSRTGDRPVFEPLHDREIGAWRHYENMLGSLADVAARDPGPKGLNP